MSKCISSCTYFVDQYGDKSCFHHGNVETTYRAGDALDTADQGASVRYRLPERHVRALYNVWPRLTMVEMSRELGCSEDVLLREHKKLGLSYREREGNTHAGAATGYR